MCVIIKEIEKYSWTDAENRGVNIIVYPSVHMYTFKYMTLLMYKVLLQKWIKIIFKFLELEILILWRWPPR